jgi:GntR family transcriptional repressor for pyruvate dehydrogenase complex
MHMDAESLIQNASAKNRLVHRVADDIQRLIASGELPPGAKLPAEREFAEQLGVSRTVVREAVHTLVAKGLLESKHGSGTIVRPMNHDALVEPLGWLIQAHGATLDHIHQVRCILEVEIARLAAAEATDEAIAGLRGIVQEMERQKREGVAFIALDAGFHQALAEMTANPLLAILLDSVRDVMEAVRLEVHRHPAVYNTVVLDHACIAAAVERRDPAAAAQAMHQHLDNARRFQQEYLAVEPMPVR